MPKTKTPRPGAIPAHHVRPPARRRKAKAAPAALSYPPGYFLEPVLRWWPAWQPAVVKDAAPQSAAESAKASAARQRLLSEGNAAARGTIGLTGTPDPKPWAAACPAARSKC